MNGRAWTDEELSVMLCMYADNKTDVIAAILKRDIKSVYHQASTMGLKKSEAFLKTSYSGRFTEPTKKGILAWFKKGHTPHNKGMSLAEYTTPAIREKIMLTAFKKGNKPHNTASDGDIRWRSDKNNSSYLYIRISKSNWRLLHVYNWERQHGKVPKGSCVVFKTPDHNNCSVTNLELITRAELAIRNSIHRYPAELKKAMKLTKKLKKLIDNGTEQN